MSKNKSSYGGGYSQNDAKRDTGATQKQVQEAHHQAREDAAKSGRHGVPSDRHSNRKR